MNIAFLITPFLAWLFAGCMKFLINSFKEKRFAFDLIGYGGLPSNHSSIVSSVVAIIYFVEGSNSSSLVVAIALAFIVMLDANSLRNKIASHAISINEITNNRFRLRERIGHSKFEILSGAIVGIFTAFIVHTALM
ncbi:divergent PAP2 family protein [Vibrio cyclitrophicus]